MPPKIPLPNFLQTEQNLLWFTAFSPVKAPPAVRLKTMKIQPPKVNRIIPLSSEITKTIFSFLSDICRFHRLSLKFIQAAIMFGNFSRKKNDNDRKERRSKRTSGVPLIIMVRESAPIVPIWPRQAPPQCSPPREYLT